MARVTVEDCLEHVDNRFELVMLASKRSRQLAVKGRDPKLDWEGDKPTVMALREIAAGVVDEKIIAEEDLIEEPVPIYINAMDDDFSDGF